MSAEVDPRLEVAEIHRRVIAAEGPALLFRRVLLLWNAEPAASSSGALHGLPLAGSARMAGRGGGYAPRSLPLSRILH